MVLDHSLTTALDPTTEPTQQSAMPPPPQTIQGLPQHPEQGLPWDAPHLHPVSTPGTDPRTETPPDPREPPNNRRNLQGATPQTRRRSLDLITSTPFLKYRLGYYALQTFVSNRISGPSRFSSIIPIENQLYDLQYKYENLADNILKQSIQSRIVALNSQHKGNMALASFLTALFYERNLSPLLVHGDGSCLFHATNAAHQALDNNTDIIPSPDLRLAACTLARDFLLSNTPLCTEQNLLELENSLDESEDVFNELIFLSLATIRNGEIIILNEMGNITSYTPHTDMKQILLQGKEHPLPPQEPIILLHRSSTVPLHYDATQPAIRISRSSSTIPSCQIPNPSELTTTPNDTQHHSALIELQPPQITQLNKETTVPIESQQELPLVPSQEDPLDNSMIPDDPPFETLPPRDNIELDEPSITNEEIREGRPQSPTCSTTDEYSDSDPELPATQLSDESSDESDLRYEQPPLDWNDMDPNQRLIWLREHQAPNQKPFKLILRQTNLSSPPRSLGLYFRFFWLFSVIFVSFW